MGKKRKKRKRTKARNIDFWRFMVKDENKLQQFLERGDRRQRSEIVLALGVFKSTEPELFERVNGKEWIKKFKEKMK